MLKRQLERRVSGNAYIKLREALRLTPNETHVLIALYGAGGQAVGYEDLVHEALSKTKAKYRRVDLVNRHAGNFVRVIVHGLRAQLGYNSIDTVVTVGYRLSPEGIAKVQQILEK